MPHERPSRRNGTRQTVQLRQSTRTRPEPRSEEPPAVNASRPPRFGCKRTGRKRIAQRHARWTHRPAQIHFPGQNARTITTPRANDSTAQNAKRSLREKPCTPTISHVDAPAVLDGFKIVSYVKYTQ